MKYLFTFCWLLSVNLLNAQYMGSDGDGQDKSKSTGMRLSGMIVTTTPLYQGGIGDGYNSNTTAQILNGQQLAMYFGGRGDGYSKTKENVLLGGDNINILYSGGVGDGFAELKQSLILNGQDVIVLYSGGIGDGFAENTQNELLLSGIMTMLFEGGVGDGFAVDLKSNLTLTEMLMLYQGGVGDGFASDIANLTLAEILMLYQGGSGDGFANNSLDDFIFSVLPVKWLSFEVVKQGSTALLLWSTASEIDNEKYEVEHSVNGILFEKINEIAGAGTTTEQQDYQALDTEPAVGFNYYRIKQVDFDGNFSYTDIESIQFSNSEIEIMVFPNPARDILNVSYPASLDVVSYSIVDVQGRMQTQNEVGIANGSTQIDVNDLAKGMYVLILETSDGRLKQIKFIKQ